MRFNYCFNFVCLNVRKTVESLCVLHPFRLHINNIYQATSIYLVTQMSIKSLFYDCKWMATAAPCNQLYWHLKWAITEKAGGDRKLAFLTYYSQPGTTIAFQSLFFFGPGFYIWTLIFKQQLSVDQSWNDWLVNQLVDQQKTNLQLWQSINHFSHFLNKQSLVSAPQMWEFDPFLCHTW